MKRLQIAFIQEERKRKERRKKENKTERRRDKGKIPFITGELGLVGPFNHEPKLDLRLVTEKLTCSKFSDFYESLKTVSD